MNSTPVTLQISLAPSDARHAADLLRHHVKTWGGQVAEVLLTLDFHRSAGRFSSGWDDGKAKILSIAQATEGARVVSVDYGMAAQARISAEFFGGQSVPAKDFRGGPFYSYFFGLAEARHDHVLHVDSDMFFGGGSQTWVAEAVQHMAAHPDELLAAPLPGPPRGDGRLLHLHADREKGADPAFRFADMSTRVFLVNRARFRARVGKLQPRRPPEIRNVLLALLDGNPPRNSPENLISEAMRAHGLFRRDFLGAAPGMYSLHPPYRSADFYARLPALIQQVESGDLPDAQLGDHDLNDSVVNWSDAKAAMARNRWWRRALG